MTEQNWRLVDINSDGHVSTGFWLTRSTALVMMGRLEKRGCKGIELDSRDYDPRKPNPGDWEAAPFDVDKWWDRWHEKGPPLADK